MSSLMQELTPTAEPEVDDYVLPMGSLLPRELPSAGPFAPVDGPPGERVPGVTGERRAPESWGATSRAPAASGLRVVGPGRRERRYRLEIQDLAAQLARRTERFHQREVELEGDLRHSQAALEVGQRVERSCQRRLDRLESTLESRTQALLESERQHKRLALVLGALQRENTQLRAELLRALPPPTEDRAPAGTPGPRAPGFPGSETAPRSTAPGLFRRLLGRFGP